MTVSQRMRFSAKLRLTRPLCLCPPPVLELSQSFWLRTDLQFSLGFNFSRYSLALVEPNQLQLQPQQLLLQQHLLHLLLPLHLPPLLLQLLLLFPQPHHRPHLVQQHPWQHDHHHHQCHPKPRQLELLQCCECPPLIQLQRLLAPGVSTG